MQALDQVQLNEYLFKVLVIGEPNVGKSSQELTVFLGKTSLIKRYVNNEFSTKYKYTIGGTSSKS
jgi:GTPase SAR1 family protein